MVLPLALSLADQVEKYGAYAGIAAFIGLAVLSLLYFAQAREVKRLREWAGRPAGRAREVERAAVGQAGAAPRAPRPAPRPIPQPVGAAPAGGGAPPSTVGQPTEEDDALPDEDEDSDEQEGGVPPATAAGAAGNGTPPPGTQVTDPGSPSK